MDMPTPPGTRKHAHTHTHKYVIFIAFPRKRWFVNAPQCYVIRILLVLLLLIYVPSERLGTIFRTNETWLAISLLRVFWSPAFSRDITSFRAVTSQSCCRQRLIDRNNHVWCSEQQLAFGYISSWGRLSSFDLSRSSSVSLHELTPFLQSHYKVTVYNYLNTSWSCDKNFRRSFVFIILQICQ
jgi:hypothetical protein